jgi:S-adenosylmethionine:tRNA ribosyltransferase-isomerase
MKDFHITVPSELIAQFPREGRDRSRLLALDVKTGTLKDDTFYNAPDYLREGDCLVYNDARVIKARVRGRKAGTGAALELLLTRRVGDLDWLALIRPARRVRAGTEILLRGVAGGGESCSKGAEGYGARDTDARAEEAADRRGMRVTVVEDLTEGLFRIRSGEPVGYEDLERLGEIPLPKYIKREPVRGLDDERYQTVYSRKPGAVASPTAGLHFSDDLLGRIRGKGVVAAPVTLYVDWGTFKPVKERDYRMHKIHRERFEIGEESAKRINDALSNGRRVVCVGTTSVRTVESAFVNGTVAHGEGETGLFIYPGYEFKVTDAMFTNFHMPDSTLLLLVAAFAGKGSIERAYEHAAARKYLFFSYGDGMFMYRR